MDRRPRSGLPALVLLLSAVSPVANATQNITGTYIDLYYSDDGVCYDHSVKRGYRVNLGGSWAEWTRNSSENAFGGAGFSYEKSSTTYLYENYYIDTLGYTADWVTLTESDTSSSTVLQSTYDWTVGDLDVTRTETWDLDGLAIFVKYSLTNTSSTKLKSLSFVNLMDPAGSTSSNTSNAVSDLLYGDGTDDWVQGSKGTTTSANTMGIGACDPETEAIGLVDMTTVDPASVSFLTPSSVSYSDVQFALTWATDELAAGDTAVFAFVVAFGAGHSAAQANYTAAAGYCLDLDEDGYENALGLDDDCDDGDDTVNPGVSETWYDGYDSNCAGDDDYDADGDGYVPDGYSGLKTKDPGTGTNIVGTGKLPDGDCDDGDDTIYPGADETWYDGIDGDCAGDSDFDADGDGYVPDAYAGEVTTDPGTGDVVEDGLLDPGDCDDSDADVGPASDEVWYNGIDEDCAGGSDFDEDGDGYVPDEYEGEPTYEPDGDLVDDGSLPAGDCDDTDGDVNPAAEETWYDSIDQDCAGDSDYDQDHDTFVPDEYEGEPTYDPGTGEVVEDGSLDPGDCNDYDPATFPGSGEIWYDGVDGDCLGDDDFDQDGDGYVRDGDYGKVTVDGFGNLIEGTGELPDGDCDDTDPQVNPGEEEEWYNDVDEDCDGNLYDKDGDGYPADGYDTNGDGVIDDSDGGDCDDEDGDINSGVEETWYNGIDEDCAEDNDYDQDHDGFVREGDEGKVTESGGEELPGSDSATGGDCDDENTSVFPGADEVWYNGIDEDCDGNLYDQDGDGTPSDGFDTNSDGVIDDLDGGDCDDTDASVIDECFVDTGGVPFYKGGGGLGCATAEGGARGGVRSWLGLLAGLSLLIRRRKRT